MPNYNQAHAFYAGVDLHARSMFVHTESTKESRFSFCVTRRDIRARSVSEGSVTAGAPRRYAGPIS